VLNLGHYKGAENGLEKALMIRKETLLQTPNKKPVPFLREPQAVTAAWGERNRRFFL
jgi:hypothetical protein